MEILIKSPITIKCRTCGEDFVFTPSEQVLYERLKYVPPTRCKACRDKLKNKTETFTCVDCGKEFILTGYDMEYFDNKGFAYPKRCKTCREYKKQRNAKLNQTE